MKLGSQDQNGTPAYGSTKEIGGTQDAPK
jgi:hypothetical protein